MIAVSVIIPIFNKSYHLEKCLKSLYLQSQKNMEVILVDDGSFKNVCLTGNEKSIFLEKEIVLKIFREPHKGAGAARNFGAKVSNGKILVFVDCDMYFERDFIEKLIKPILEGKTNGTFSKNEYVANWNNIWARCYNYYFGLNDKLKIPKNFPEQSPVFRAIAKNEFAKSGGFDCCGYDDDWSLSHKLSSYATLATGAVYYHYNPETLTQVFIQAKWRAKRKYKFGLLGELSQILIHLFPLSVIDGLINALKYQTFEMIPFTLIFDFATIMGIFEKIIKHENY